MKTTLIPVAVSTRLLLFIGAACILLRGLMPCQAQEPSVLLHTLFTPSTRAQGNAQFGSLVAANSSYWVVAASLADGIEIDTGAVFVYDAASGALLHRLNNPEPGTNDHFGFAVSISGNKLVVSADRNDVPATQADGSIYVYDLAGATPTIPFLTIHNPGSVESFFGKSVAISGNHIAVHASANFDGTVFYFDIGAATPATPLQTITSNSFRNATVLAMEGTRLIAGVASNVPFGPGIVFVYDVGGASPTVPVHTIDNPAPESLDGFGGAIGLAGNLVVVGAKNDDAGATNAGIAYLYDLASATPTVPSLTFNNPAPDPNDNFGVGVAISENRVLIGASFDTVGANPDAGVTFVYDLTAGTPTQPVLTINNPSPAGSTGFGDAFGSALALAGNRAVLGAGGEDTTLTNVGAAYAYDLDGATPATPTHTLTSEALKSQDLFGQVVAVSGNRAAIVAGGAVGTSNGEIYHFDLASATPAVSIGTIANPAPGGNFFANTIGLSGNLLLAGYHLHPAGSTTHLYDLGSATPATPARTFSNPTAINADNFGFAVAISGTRIVVGAPMEDTGASNAGKAYVYDNAGGTPTTPIAILPNPSPATDDNFGLVVAMDGTRIAVSTPADDTGAVDAGTVYIFDLNSGTPTVPVHTLNNPAAADGDKFGAALAISGAWLIVGAPDDDAGAANAGTAYAYHLASATPTVPFATLTNPAPAAGDAYAFSVAISGTTTVIGSYLDDASATDGGTAYVYDVGTATPATIRSTLYNPTPAIGDKFGAGVGVSGTTAVIGAPNDDTIVLNKGAGYVFGLEPEIAVEQPAAQDIADGGLKNYGTILLGTSVTFNFALKNTGTSNLTGVAISKDGAHAAEFHILQNPAATVIPGGSTTFIIRFTPVTSGSKTAAVHLTNSDFDENPFDIDLAGVALSHIEDRDNDGMNDWAEYQLAAQGFDYTLSQPAIVSSFYAAANSAGLYTPAQVQALHVGTSLLQTNPVTGQFKLNLRIEKSTNLGNFAPFPFAAPTTTINEQGEIEFLFTAPDNAAFYRLLYVPGP